MYLQIDVKTTSSTQTIDILYTSYITGRNDMRQNFSAKTTYQTNTLTYYGAVYIAH